jgi:hypothetical protein
MNIVEVFKTGLDSMEIESDLNLNQQPTFSNH